MNHEWKNIDYETKTKVEHISVLKKYGIGYLIHSSCKKTVSIAQLDENNKMVCGTLVLRNFDYNLCEVK